MEIGLTQPLRVSRRTEQYIRPEDHNDVMVWCRKWNVTPHQIQQAILHTGTLHATTIKEYLVRDRWIYHPVEGTAKLLRNTINYIF